ncbi:MAG: TldD/PmbA family protein [Crenarchaeota archaeon]|nr:TldD/PmbA family protein [Thermoproteota archaeon]
MDVDLLGFIVDYAGKRGASYAEARLHVIDYLEVTSRNGELIGIGSWRSSGIGIRLIYNGVLVFAAGEASSREEARSLVEEAIAKAKAGAGFRHGLSEERLGRARYELKPVKPLEDVSIEEKTSLHREAWESLVGRLREAKPAAFAVEYMEAHEYKAIVTSDGAFIESSIPRVSLFANITLASPQKGSIQRFIELGASGGYEAVESWRLSERVAEEAGEMEEVLMKGVEPPKEPVRVVLGSEVVGLIVHESCGHPMEADRIWGREAAQAGESFVKPDMIGRYVIGNEQATVIDDPTIPGSFGYYLFDDEGVPARPRYLYLRGVLNEPLHTRWSAYIFNTHSNAAARAMDYTSEPIPRMANTYLAPGDMSLEELFEEARDGVYIKNYMEWNIDDIRWGQRYVGLAAYRIRNGELAEPIRNPAIEFTTKWFYSNIAAKSKKVEFYAGLCGKGEPMQGVPVWFGGPHVLLNPLKLGVAPK